MRRKDQQNELSARGTNAFIPKKKIGPRIFSSHFLPRLCLHAFPPAVVYDTPDTLYLLSCVIFPCESDEIKKRRRALHHLLSSRSKEAGASVLLESITRNVVPARSGTRAVRAIQVEQPVSKAGVTSAGGTTCSPHPLQPRKGRDGDSSPDVTRPLLVIRGGNRVPTSEAVK